MIIKTTSEAVVVLDKAYKRLKEAAENNKMALEIMDNMEIQRNIEDVHTLKARSDVYESVAADCHMQSMRIRRLFAKCEDDIRVVADILMTPEQNAVKVAQKYQIQMHSASQTTAELCGAYVLACYDAIALLHEEGL